MSATLTNRSRLLERYSEVVRQDGLNTNKNVNIGINGATPNLWVAGNLSIGGTFTGQLESVVDLTASTATVTAAQSGTIFMLDRAAGVTVTLPTAVAGITYTFFVNTSVTSNSYKVTVGASNGVMVGLLQTAASSGGAADQWQSASASTNISVTQNGSTTGGLQGSMFVVTCLTSGASGVWMVDGQLAGSGTLATPFSTS